MIERETASDKERPLIASVIYNRLRAGHPARDRRHDPLRGEQLVRPAQAVRARQGRAVQHPQAPGPAADADRQPGLASLQAAAKPARTDYIFYVAKPGACHAFSSTDAEFERDVAAYEAGAGGERRQGAAAEVLTYLGVAGWPVAHSRSPAMHNAALAAVGLHDWRYLKLPLPPARFAETVRALGAAGFRGLNVTIPHKEAALALADEATPMAAAVGAANTLTFEPGRRDPGRQHRRARAARGARRRPGRQHGAGARRGRRGAGRGLRPARRRRGRRDGLEPDPRARRAARRGPRRTRRRARRSPPR